MGRDNQAKDRQLRRKVAKEVQRASYARILIVTDGSKTEPLYLEEIRAAHQLHSANVEVQPGQAGRLQQPACGWKRRRYARRHWPRSSMRTPTPNPSPTCTNWSNC